MKDEKKLKSILIMMLPYLIRNFQEKIMLLNVARLEVYEPMTYDGGIKGVCKRFI